MGTQSFLYIVIGDGVVGGTICMVSFYAAIKGALLSQVMSIAFTFPLFGAFFTMVGIVLLTI